MTTGFGPPHTRRKNRRKVVLSFLAGVVLASGRAGAAAPVDSEIGIGVGVPQAVRLTDSWTGTQYQVAMVAERNANGKLVLAKLVVTRAGDPRNLIAKPHGHGLQDDDFAALEFANGPETPAYWDRHITLTKDDELVVRTEDAQVRAVPGVPTGQVGSEEIISLRLHIVLHSPTAPQPTPKAFVTEQYGLTFKTPPDSSYCALPADWSGSDHGTVVFLVPPKGCFGVGFPSSGRGFASDPPRVEIYYGYDTADDEADQKPTRCQEIGRVTFLNSVRPLCSTRVRRGMVVSISAKYMADVAAEASLTLVTTPARLKSDLESFRALLQSARTCTATWHDDQGGKPFTTGSGPPCPDDAQFF